MEEMINHLIVLGGAMGILGVAYFAWLVSGVGNMAIKDTLKNWSWSRFGKDLLKVFCFAVSMAACSITSDALSIYIDKLQIAQLSAFMDTISWGVIIVIPLMAACYLLYRAIKNNKSLVDYENAAKLIGVGEDEKIAIVDNSKELADDIKKAIDTLTKKTAQEQLAEDGIELEGEIVSEEEAGQGGLYNSYPEPYRSAAKDSLVDPSTCYNRECVSYCAWKICELKGSWPPRTGSMNAKDWIYRLPSWGYNEVARPVNGGRYVGVVTGGQYGHVVWFEYDNTISEYNYASLGNYGVRTINLGEYRWYQIQAPPAPTPTPTPTPTTDFKVGDNVTLTNWVDYNGTPLLKTRDYYTISQLSGDRAVLVSGSTVYAAVNTANLKKVDVAPSPAPAPAPTPSSGFHVGDTVVPTALVDYNGTPLIQWDPSYVITQIDGDRAVLSARGAIWAAMNTANIRKA